MPELAAPYFSPEQLNGQPGDPALSGVTDLDTRNPAPFKGVNDAISQFNQENDSALQQKRQQVFQAKQNQLAYQRDTLAKAVDYSHADAVMKYKQAIEDRNNLYKMISSTGGSAHNLKDENGQDMSFAPLPSDETYLTKTADELTKGITSDPSAAMNDPAFQKKVAEYTKAKNISSVRAIEIAKLNQQLAQTGDPEERKNIAASIETIKKTPLSALQLPEPHLPSPVVKSLLPDPAKTYPQGKGMESFDIDGVTYKGIPTADFEGLLYANDHNTLNQAYLNTATLPKLPEGSNPQAFQAWNERVQKMWKDRGGEEPLQLGNVTPEGKVVLNPDPRPLAVAMELDNKGHLIKDDDAQKDAADLRLKNAQAAKAEKEAKGERVGKPTAEELKEDQNKKAAQSMYDEVKTTLGDATSKNPIKPNYPSWWKRNGVNPDEYTIYPEISKDAPARRYIGIEADPTTVTTSEGSKTTTKSIAGESKHPDKIFPIVNKKTGEKELAYVKDGNIIAKVPEKQAIINGLKHESKYKPSDYEGKTAHVDEIYNSDGKPEVVKTTKIVEPVAVKPIRKEVGGATYEKGSDGKWYKL